MGDRTGIEWTEATWNPIVGCSVVSPGCTHCYAMRTAGARTAHTAKYAGLTQASKAGPVWTGEVRLWEPALLEPLRWRAPRTIFVNSMGDLFHEAVPDAWIDRVFAVMALAPQHTFQVLTKRAARMRGYLSAPGVSRRVYEIACEMTVEDDIDVVLILPFVDPNSAPAGRKIFLDIWPLANVWLGVSAERQAEADERVPLLLDTPAAVRFVSCEPLLGPIDLYGGDPDPRLGGVVSGPGLSLGQWWAADDPPGAPPRPGIDWVIAGGESGPGARPVHPDWARSLRDQCQAAGVPFFFKQWGEWVSVSEVEGPGAHHSFPDGATVRRTGKKLAGRRLDGRLWDGMPGSPLSRGRADGAA